MQFTIVAYLSRTKNECRQLYVNLFFFSLYFTYTIRCVWVYAFEWERRWTVSTRFFLHTVVFFSALRSAYRLLSLVFMRGNYNYNEYKNQHFYIISSWDRVRYETILFDSLHFFVQLCALVWCQPNRSLFRLYCYFNDLFLLYNVTLQANSLNWFLRFVRLFVGRFVRCWMIESWLFTTWPNTTYQPTINYFNPVCTRAHWPWLRIR